MVVVGGMGKGSSEIFSFSDWAWREGPTLPIKVEMAEAVQVLFCDTFGKAKVWKTINRNLGHLENPFFKVLHQIAFQMSKTFLVVGGRYENGSSIDHDTIYEFDNINYEWILRWVGIKIEPEKPTTEIMAQKPQLMRLLTTGIGNLTHLPNNRVLFLTTHLSSTGS